MQQTSGKSKKDLRNQKYKKAHKDRFLMINQMHLQSMDPLNDLEKLQQEQDASYAALKQANEQKKKSSVSSSSKALVPPPSRYALYELVPKFTNRKQLGFVRLVTNKGFINLELYCSHAPKACDNFLQLCELGRYNKTRVHRLIKNFMMQTGRQLLPPNKISDKSIWEQPFADEFNDNLKHDKRGILSMANSGPNTNGSELYVLFYSYDCKNTNASVVL